MILADTSVWIDHLNATDRILVARLNEGRIFAHAFVIGEVALGNLKHRKTLLSDLHDLPQAILASDQEVLQLIERKTLAGMGIGYVDAHLLASVLLTPHSVLWTRDRRLMAAATKLGVCYRP